MTSSSFYNIIKSKHTFDSKGDYMAKLLIRREEMILLKNSESAKNSELYGNLYNIIQPYEVLTEDEFKSNPLFDDKARAVILNNKKSLFEEIKSEWSAIHFNDESTTEVHCQLCNTKNKFVYYIHNKKNDIELNVGSDCIKKFPGIENLSNQRRSLNEYKKQQSELKRKIEFDEIDLENINFNTKFEAWFKNFKIMLSYNLFTQIKNSLHNLNLLRTNYIKNGGDINYVKEQYFLFKNNLEFFKEEAENYYNSIKNNPLVCKKDLSNWLHETNPSIWQKVLENDGILTADTLKHCYQNTYVKSKLKIFNSRLAENDISIVGINGNIIRFVMKNNDYTHPLIFTMKCDMFMEKIGCYCLTDKKYFFHKYDLSNCNIEQSQSNFNALCNRLLSPLEKIGLSIHQSEYTNDVYYVRLPKVVSTSPSGTKSKFCEIGYKKVAISALYNLCTPLIFSTDEEIQNDFKKRLTALNRTSWLNQDEFKKAESLAKTLSIQKQREFVPYI